MTMEASSALQEKVERSQIRDHEVSVDVEGLLKNLGADDRQTPRSLAAGAWRPELVTQASFPVCSITGQEPTVDQGDAIAEGGFERRIGFLSCGHGITHDDDDRSRLNGVRHCPDQAILLQPLDS